MTVVYLFFITDKVMAEASFTGEEFLKYMFDGNTEGDSFVLHFKTKQPAGLLYHMGKCTCFICRINY